MTSAVEVSSHRLQRSDYAPELCGRNLQHRRDLLDNHIETSARRGREKAYKPSQPRTICILPEEVMRLNNACSAKTGMGISQVMSQGQISCSHRAPRTSPEDSE